MNLNELLPELIKGFSNFTLGNGVMITAALILVITPPQIMVGPSVMLVRLAVLAPINE